MYADRFRFIEAYDTPAGKHIEASYAAFNKYQNKWTEGQSEQDIRAIMVQDKLTDSEQAEMFSWIPKWRIVFEPGAGDEPRQRTINRSWLANCQDVFNVIRYGALLSKDRCYRPGWFVKVAASWKPESESRVHAMLIEAGFEEAQAQEQMASVKAKEVIAFAGPSGRIQFREIGQWLVALI